MPHVFCKLYFLPHKFSFLSKVVPVVWEKIEMVPPSNFSSKTNVQPCHPTGVGVHVRPCLRAHLSVRETSISASTVTSPYHLRGNF
jgi:hypothetical protein